MDNDSASCRGIISDALLKKLLLPFANFPRIAIGVSGGPDSAALMLLAARWAGLTGRDRTSITVLTVDHGLRAESCAEARFCRELAASIGFHHETLLWEGEKPKAAIQARAREARYALMTAYCRAHGISCLATAHTADDQAETLLMRLQRGSGADGLAAIAPETEREGLTLLRPLLSISKARLFAYLREADAPFVRDPTNENLDYERPRLRHAIRAMRQAGFRREALVRSASRLRRAVAALDRIVESFLDLELFVSPLGDGYISRVALGQTPAEIQIRVYSSVLGLLGGGTPSPRLSKIEALFEKSQIASWKTTLGGCSIIASADRIRFYREPGRIAPIARDLSAGERVLWDGRFDVELSSASANVFTVSKLGHAGWNVYRQAAKQGALKNKALRLAALSTPAIWRDDCLIAAPLIGWSNPIAGAEFPLAVTVSLAKKIARFVKLS